MHNSTPDEDDAGWQAADPTSTAEVCRKSVRGAGLLLSSRGLLTGVRIGSTIVLARLLTPEDFGLVGMVLALVPILSLLDDMGLQTAAVQKSNLSRIESSTLFWVNCALGGLTAGLALLMAPAIAWFYDDPRLLSITAILSTTFAIKGVSAQHHALLKRRLRFGTLAWVQFGSTILAVAVGISMGFSGAGYWSLVGMSVAEPFVAALLVWLACNWTPGRPASFSTVVPELRFGGWLSLSEVLSAIGQGVDKILLGYFFGAHALGVYGRGQRLGLLPVQQIRPTLGSVFIPATSRLGAQDERYRSYCCKSLSSITMVIAPLVACAAAIPTQIVLATLGPQWVEAAQVFRVFALQALILPVLHLCGWMMISRGQTRRLAWWTLIRMSITIPALVIGLRWGPIGVAVALLTCTWILLLPCVRFAAKGLPLDEWEILASLWRPLVVAMTMFCGVWVTHISLPTLHAFWDSVLSCAIGLALSCLLLSYWPGARREFDRLMRNVTTLLPEGWRRPGSSTTEVGAVAGRPNT